MDSVSIGDATKGPSGPDTVVNWIHRDTTATTQFLTITTDNGILEVSPKHLIYLNGEYKFADRSKIGDFLTTSDNKPAKITDISTFYDVGVYAPITNSGELFVNGFRVSCYAYYESHEVAHYLMKPLLWLSSLSENGIHWFPKIVKGVYDRVA